ncbi:hypothetical protein [Flavobacterium sp.]|uniref:hypothetical protein n=1 Tax=Flavobacterium sp. TaxID=239 RepID=UPI002630697B|nr:hypothetical protein [Flavobacterium sp.]
MNNTVDYFWIWFIVNHKKLQDLRKLKPKEQKHFTFWLNWHLHFYAPGIDYILIFPHRQEKHTQMIITANGNPEYFRKVEEVVAAAPQLRDWKFTAFVQPSHDYEELEKGLDKPYVFQDITLKVSDLKFVPFEYEGEKKMDMIVYLKNYTVYSHDKNLLQLIYFMMQDLLGEKSLYENINFVELAQLPEENENELICLYDLQFYIDEINKDHK